MTICGVQVLTGGEHRGVMDEPKNEGVTASCKIVGRFSRILVYTWR